MKMVTFSKTKLKGPGQIKEKLSMPPQKLDFYKDIAIIAFPAFENRRSMHDYPFKITSDLGINPARMTDLNMHTYASFNPPAQNKPSSFTITFEKPFSAAAFIFADNYDNQNEIPGRLSISYSPDGKDFTLIKEFNTEKSTHTRVDFPEVVAKHFKITILNYGPAKGAAYTIPEIELLGTDGIPYMPKINDFEVKAGYWIRRRDQRPASPVPANWIIDKEKIVILTDKLDDQWSSYLGYS
jgi:hypothetical protein